MTLSWCSELFVMELSGTEISTLNLDWECCEGDLSATCIVGLLPTNNFGCFGLSND